MSHIVSDQQRRKPKRPKAAGEGEQSERGKPVLTISQRSHRRRSQDIAEDHGFSPPKDDNYPSAVELGFSPPKGQMNRFLENNDDDDEDDRQNDAMNVQTKRTEKKKKQGHATIPKNALRHDFCNSLHVRPWSTDGRVPAVVAGDLDGGFNETNVDRARRIGNHQRPISQCDWVQL